MNVQQEIVSTIDIARALAKLSPEKRAAIVLHYSGLTYKQVANRLGWPTWKVKKRISEALCAMRMFWGVSLPEQSSAAAAQGDWWPVLMESMWRHATSMGLSIGTDVSN